MLLDFGIVKISFCLVFKFDLGFVSLKTVKKRSIWNQLGSDRLWVEMTDGGVLMSLVNKPFLEKTFATTQFQTILSYFPLIYLRLGDAERERVLPMCTKKIKFR